MAKCPNCNEVVDENEQFCPKCGQLVKTVKNVKEFVAVKSEAPKVKNDKKDNKLRQIFITLKGKIPKKLDYKSLTIFIKRLKPYLKKLSHPLKPALEYSAKHKYVFFIILFVILSTGSYLANSLLSGGAKTQKVDFVYPVQPLPANGVLSDNSQGAKSVSIKISAQENIDTHYFIKVLDVNKNSTAVTAFLYPGKTIKISLPVGIYEVRYAAGSKWYGMGYLFGSETYYGKTVEKIELTYPVDYPYPIEMYGKYGGNLRTDEIKKGEF